MSKRAIGELLIRTHGLIKQIQTLQKRLVETERNAIAISAHVIYLDKQLAEEEKQCEGGRDG